MRLLIVEDEKSLLKILEKGFKEEGYGVDIASDGEEGLYMAENILYDAIILDIMLPKVDGLTILSTIRKKDIATPVVMLTARDTTGDKITGLDTGADDYMTKPFDFDELLARVRSLVRRKSSVKEAVIRIDDLEINTASHTVKRGGVEVTLSAREYSMLEYMAYNKDTVLSRSAILEHVYSEEVDLDSNIVDVYINYLRKKLDSGSEKKLIHTVRGAGYILRDPQTE